VVHTVSGVYRETLKDDAAAETIERELKSFAFEEGRPLRMLVAKLGQDGHDRGAKVIASGFADFGFDIEVGPLFQTPSEAAGLAVSSGAHVVGISSHAAGHRTLVPQLISELKGRGGHDVIVVCGGVIPPKDYDELFAAGVSLIFGPGTQVTEAAGRVLATVREARRAARERVAWPANG
jgi:methylmalonyl-CoA mutase